MWTENPEGEAIEIQEVAMTKKKLSLLPKKLKNH